jgi:predicted TIM-barrel fold metal-dependent hydrolase
MSVSALDVEAVGDSNERVTDRTLIISSDGHAMAHMRDYRPYLASRWHTEFDEFCELYEKGEGARPTDASTLLLRTDPEIVEQWTREVLDPGWLEGVSNAKARIQQQDRDGVAAEVLFPDFGLPFQFGSVFRSALRGHAARSPEQVDAGNRAHNRWLADFCAEAPQRFAAMACVSFDDVDAAVKEIHWAHEAGFKGVMLPLFEDSVPIFDRRFDPIWNTVEELGMPLNSHIGLSSITARVTTIPAPPHPGSGNVLTTMQTAFFCHQLLAHLIWGGVLDRHPDMKVVFTETGSGWVVDELQAMDYKYEGSYLRRDTREVVRFKPSEYFARQCFLGSSLFSQAEIEARYEIGIDKMALGMDYPHHEGAWAAGPGTLAYLRATLGAAHVPMSDARMMLSENAAALWDLNIDALGGIAERIGPSLQEILTPPPTDEYPRGDAHRPL